MFVKDIYNDVMEVTAFADQTTNFGRITDGVEVLSNKGQFDGLLSYLDIPIQNQNIVTLPREVEVPIKVNVDNTPSFSRDRIYEFTLNGPGSNTQRSDFSWEDPCNVPPMLAIPAVLPAFSTLYLYADTQSSADDGKRIFIYGKDTSGADASDILILNFAVSPSTSTQYSSITRIYKETTIGNVTLHYGGTPPSDVLSVYAPNENEPSYRQIRLSKTGVTAHILFRRNRYVVQSMDDFIPVNSKMGLLYMIKSLEAYRRNDPTTGKALGDQAVQLATELQKGRNSFIELAAQTEVDSARNLNVNNRDSIIVSDIYDDACQIVGKVGEKNVYDSIT